MKQRIKNIFRRFRHLSQITFVCLVAAALLVTPGSLLVTIGQAQPEISCCGGSCHCCDSVPAGESNSVGSRCACGMSEAPDPIEVAVENQPPVHNSEKTSADTPVTTPTYIGEVQPRLTVITDNSDSNHSPPLFLLNASFRI